MSPGGVTTATTYDPDNRPLQVQESASGSVLRTTSATYTPSGKPATATDANNNVTRFAYDLLDRRIKATDPMGRITSWAYDSLSRPTAVANPGVQTAPLAQQSFTANGQRASLTDANSNVTTYTWDGFDRLAATSWPDSSYETLGYDADSNVVSRGTRAGQPIAYAYDTLNRLVTKTPPAPWPIISYAYDLAGRVTSVSDTSAAIQPVATPGSTTAYTTSTAYDALNRPTGVSWDPAPAATAPAAGTVVAFGHSYNAANQRTAQTVSDTAWLAYPAATPATTAYTANALNQYTAVGGVTPTYDGNANLTFDGTTTLGHDPENRLVSATGAGNTAAYAFDPRGRRKVRTVNGTTTVTITGADNRELLDYDGSNGALLRWYAYGPGPNAVLNQMNVGSGTRDTLLPDLLGSIVASVDSGTGNVSPFGYRPYGTTAAAPAQFGYTGQRVDQETGLYYYRARHYSPQWGRFTQADPIGYQGGVNLYGYVQNDPLNFNDPEGLLLEGLGVGFRETFIGSSSTEILDTFAYGSSGRVTGAAVGMVSGLLARTAVETTAIVTGEAWLARWLGIGAGTAVAGSTSGAFSRIAPGGGLMASENAGGHLLARHVGQSEAQLAARLASDSTIPAASTFATRAQAELAVATAFDANAALVSGWVANGARGKLALSAPFSGGTVLQRGATAAAEGTSVRVILQGNGAGRYHVLTGYPLP